MMGKNPYQEAIASMGLQYEPPLVATLRDQFAMAALVGIIVANRNTSREVAGYAYGIADAMLAARGGK